MKDILFETNYREYKKALKIDEKKFMSQRILFSVAFAILGMIVLGVVYVTQENAKVFFATPFVLLLGAFMGWKYMYIQLKLSYDRNIELLHMLFPEFLNTFMGMMTSRASSNVVSVLRSTVPYTREPIKSQLIKMLIKIDQDTSTEATWEAFSEFADYMKSSEANTIMMTLFDMYTTGINMEALKELEKKIAEMDRKNVEEFAKNKALRVENISLPAFIGTVFYIFAWAGALATLYLKNAL